MTSIHYRPGEKQQEGGGWLAAVHENIALLVELPGTAAGVVRLDELWNSLRSAQAIQTTLEELTRNGLSATPSFALVKWADGSNTVTAVIRGAVTLITHADKITATTDARDVSTWREQHYTDVSRFELKVGVAGAKETVDQELLLPLHSGVTWASSLIVDRTTLATAPPTAIASPTATVKPKSVVLAPPPTVAEVVPQVVAPVEWVDTEATVNGLTSISDAVPPALPAETTGTEVADDSSYDYLFGETMFRTVEDAAVRDESEPEADAPEATHTSVDAAGDHDGHTIASADIAKLRAGRKARGPARSPAPASAPHLYLETSTGSREELTQPVLVGRAPSLSKVSGGQMPRLVTVGGSDQDISRNHARFAIEGGTVVVTDLHSRNGTTIILPGRPPQQLRQGEPTSVITGTVVDLGDGVTFTVRED
ncbi:MAG: FHA domain-containing protein [Lacisediminihabitans sp.]